MKKIITILVSVLFVILTMVTASADGMSKFNITLVSETDKQAVVSIDFNGGTNFSGFDFEVKLNKERVEVVSAEKGEGFNTFRDQADAAFAEINPDSDPVKATMAVIPAYRNVDSKSLFVITLKKLSKEPLTNDDFKIVVTNCVDSSLAMIETSVTTDLQGESVSVSTTDTVSSSEATDEKTSAKSDDEIEYFTNGLTEDMGEVIDIEDEENDENKDDKDNSPKGIIIAVVSVVFVAAVGGVTVLVMKKKKSPESGNEE